MKAISIIVISANILALTACSHQNLDIPHANDYAQVYMPQASTYPNQQNIFIIDSPQVVQYNAYLGGPITPGAGLTVNFSVDTLLTDTFNIQNGTTYPVLPEANYRMDTSAAIIRAGQLSSSSLTITIEPAGLKVNQSYLLPVTIKSVSGNYKINSQMRTTYFLISGGYPPGEVVPWNKFNAIIPYNQSWILKDTVGNLWNYPTDAAGNFGPPVKYASGWDQYDMMFQYGNAIIARRRSDGGLWQIPISTNGSLGLAKQIGQGWGIFSYLFGYKGSLLAITANNGSLWHYPLDTLGNFGAAGQIGQGWNVVSAVFASSDAIMAVNNGNLWRYPLDADGNFDYGNIRQVGVGWNIFNMLLYDRNNNSIIGRKADGTLWQYPLDANDNPGLPRQIGE